MNIELHIADLAAAYGARTVFSAVSLSMRTGEVLVVSGANGSGKSTLLRVLAGLQPPLSGTAYYTVAGEAYLPLDAAHLIGWVAPDLMLYRELTARENLRFFAAVRGLNFSDAELEALLERIGLPGRADDRLAAYSSGMAQRLRYAYALLHRPPVLLLDEPTVTLDTSGAAVVDTLINAQRAHGIVVIATNDPRELRYADLLLRLGIA